MSEEFKTLEEFESLEETLQALRGEIKAIKIMRDGKYLTTIYPEELQGWDIQEWLKEKFGGGKYTLQLIKKDGKFGKSYTFIIEGKPKEPEEETVKDPTVLFLLNEIKELKEELRKKETTNNGDMFKYLLELEKENRKETFQLMLELMKNKEEKKSSLLEEFIKGIVKNPSVLAGLGAGAWKLLEKILAKRDELIELVRIAKDDPELKSVISDVLSAKYGGNKSFLEAIIENPETINKFLETLNNLLATRQVSNRVSNSVSNQLDTVSNQYLPEVSNQVSNHQEVVEVNPMNVYMKLFNLLAQGKNAKEIYDSLTDSELDYLIQYLEATGIETVDELIGVLKASGIPKEYIEVIKGNKAVVEEFFKLLFTENTEN